MKKIKLSQGQFALVDDEDFERVNKLKWCAVKRPHTFYALKTKPKSDKSKGSRAILMHRFILGITDPQIKVDHKNHNGIDNQKHNIRIATNAQNCANKRAIKSRKSKYLGVSRQHGKWTARIGKNGINKHLGRFEKEIDAAIAYNNAAIKIHGEFANLNKIPVS